MFVSRKTRISAQMNRYTKLDNFRTQLLIVTFLLHRLATPNVLTDQKINRFVDFSDFSLINSRSLSNSIVVQLHYIQTSFKVITFLFE